MAVYEPAMRRRTTDPPSTRAEATRKLAVPADTSRSPFRQSCSLYDFFEAHLFF